jgi:hypothetical protein
MTPEVVHCPSCNEDVPETLYCLNCGYPLYKIEKEKTLEPEITEEDIVEETEIEELTEDEGVTIEVAEEPEIEDISESMEPEEVTEEMEAETVVEAEPEGFGTDNLIDEAETETFNEGSQEFETETIVEEPDIDLDIGDMETELGEELEEAPEVPLYESEDLLADFAPDPMTREVMENLAKNITLKIRLVKLLETGQVKEDTFRKLFDNYVDQGKIWVSRRDETMRRFKADIERMERELVEAQEEFELLEIRRSIGDTTDEEYGVKAPAYKWDMEHLDKAIKNRSAGVAYLANLQRLVPDEEIERLQQMADSEFDLLNDLDRVSEETITRIRETLDQALKILVQ